MKPWLMLLLAACAPNLPPEGSTYKRVVIDSYPTECRIYIDDVYMGETPLRRKMWFSSHSRNIVVVAEPMYPNQSRHVKLVTIPPLPARITFFMNTPPESLPMHEGTPAESAMEALAERGEVVLPSSKEKKPRMSMPGLMRPNILFALDDALLSEQAKEILDENAAWLKQHMTVRVRLLGHGDERGSQQYNERLGLKRALAVRAALVRRGIAVERLEVGSLGKKDPVLTASNEQAWAHNRRVEFVLLHEE